MCANLVAAALFVLAQPYLRLAAAVVPLIVTTVTPASIT
jgi:hypothetical protein